MGERKSGLDVNILTYNLFIRPPLVNNNGNDYKSERIECFKAHVSKYDIVGLEELFGSFSGRQSDFHVFCRSLGYHVMCISRPLLAIIDGGLTLVSRYPFVQQHQLIFSQSTKSDFMAGKGCIHALLALPNGVFLHVFVTHTQAIYTGEARELAVQESQFEELAAFIKQVCAGDSHSVLLLGDLNVDSRAGLYYSRALDHLSTAMPFVDLLSSFHNGDHPVTFGAVDDQGNPMETTLTHPAVRTVAESLDYILYSKREGSSVPLTCEVQPFFVQDKPFTQLSDHYGVTATLHFN